MKSKQEYRVHFQELGKRIKITTFVEDVGIAKSSYSLFLNGSDGILSVKKLDKLEEHIMNYLGDTYNNIMSDRQDSS